MVQWKVGVSPIGFTFQTHPLSTSIMGERVNETLIGIKSWWNHLPREKNMFGESQGIWHVHLTNLAGRTLMLFWRDHPIIFLKIQISDKKRWIPSNSFYSQEPAFPNHDVYSIHLYESYSFTDFFWKEKHWNWGERLFPFKSFKKHLEKKDACHYQITNVLGIATSGYSRYLYQINP